MKQIHFALVGVLGACLALTACTKQIKKEPTRSPAAASAIKELDVAAVQPETETIKGSYVVKKGESLWKISAKQSVFGDPFRWPLLFKANRDQIADPDLIEVKQDLQFRKNYDPEEVEDAVQKAKETPAFVPHSAPRKSLPVKY